jgi:hypothetical protein
MAPGPRLPEYILPVLRFVSELPGTPTTGGGTPGIARACPGSVACKVRAVTGVASAGHRQDDGVPRPERLDEYRVRVRPGGPHQAAIAEDLARCGGVPVLPGTWRFPDAASRDRAATYVRGVYGARSVHPSARGRGWRQRRDGARPFPEEGATRADEWSIGRAAASQGPR